MLACFAQLAAWWLKRQKRLSLRKTLGVAAAVCAAALFAGPIVGGLVSASVSVVMMIPMARRLKNHLRTLRYASE